MTIYSCTEIFRLYCNILAGKIVGKRHGTYFNFS